MFNPYAAAAGALIGLAAHQENKRNAERQRKEQATREAMSPWTGQHGQFVNEPSFMATVGGSTIGLGSSMPNFGVGEFSDNPDSGTNVTEYDSEELGPPVSRTNWDNATDEEGNLRKFRAPPTDPSESPWSKAVDEEGRYRDSRSDQSAGPRNTRARATNYEAMNPWADEEPAPPPSSRRHR